jgi:hypothetical protein
MNWGKLGLASVVGAVVFVVVGFVWHAVLFAATYQQLAGSLMRAEPMVQVALLSEVLRAVLLAYLYPIGYQGGAPWKEGLRFGVLMGLFSALITLIYVGVLNFDGFGVFWMDLLFFSIQGGIGGIGIALVYGRRETPAPTDNPFHSH